MSDEAQTECQQWLESTLINCVGSDTRTFHKAEGAALSKMLANTDAASRYESRLSMSNSPCVCRGDLTLIKCRRMSLETALFEAPTSFQAGFCPRLATYEQLQGAGEDERTAMIRKVLV